MDIVVSSVRSSSPKYGQVWQLREDILRRPIGLSLVNEDLSADHQDDIFIAEHDGAVIGCLMLHPADEHCIKFRQMAVAEDWQGKGIGRQLMLAAEQFCKGKGYEKITLHARKVAMGFYSGLGYTTAGVEFEEVGISHYRMDKEIQSRPATA